MNIVFDDGLKLEDEYRRILTPLLPIENAPLRLDSITSKTDGTPCLGEEIVFLTHLPVDVLKYHSIFFEKYKDSPQWFLVLINQNDSGIIGLRNAARKHNLKNCAIFHAGSIEAFEAVIKKILNAKHIVKGKALLLSKHKREWTSSLASLLFEDKSEYEIMDSISMSDTDSEILLLCGENISDFKGIVLPSNMEPYFVFRFKNDLQHYINQSQFIAEISKSYHMTIERVKSRLYFVDIESEMWLSNTNKTTGEDAVSDGILLFDCFGLPVSRSEYTETNIELVAHKYHEDIEKLKKIM